MSNQTPTVKFDVVATPHAELSPVLGEHSRIILTGHSADKQSIDGLIRAATIAEMPLP